MLVVTARRPAAQLTPREIEVVELLDRGFTPKEIAGRKEISVATVRGHIESARVRFGARTTHELVGLFVRARGTRPREEPRTT